jgi:hypothetical protein
VPADRRLPLPPQQLMQLMQPKKQNQLKKL